MRIRSESGGMDGPIWAAILLLLFGLLLSGYASYHALTLFRGQVQQALSQATRLAAEQVQPSAVLASHAGVDAQAAAQAFAQVLPPLLAMLPTGVSTGPWVTVVLQTYQTAGGTTPGPDWPITGPGVFAEIAAPVQARLFGIAPITFTMTVAALELAPVRNIQTQTWQNGG